MLWPGRDAVLIDNSDFGDLDMTNSYRNCQQYPPWRQKDVPINVFLRAWGKALLRSTMLDDVQPYSAEFNQPSRRTLVQLNDCPANYFISKLTHCKPSTPPRALKVTNLNKSQSFHLFSLFNQLANCNHASRNANCASQLRPR
jgi:hypothetical protein